LGLPTFVIQFTVDIAIPRNMRVQYTKSQRISGDALESGDLAFFANTFRQGLSHNGIYLGDGQLIHAENEGAGVTISDLTADYYASRWYGTVRCGSAEDPLSRHPSMRRCATNSVEGCAGSAQFSPQPRWESR
jgi:hypothetical protein